MPPTNVDQFARDEVRDVRHQLANHVMTTDIQVKNLFKELEGNEKTLREKMDVQHNNIGEKVDQIRSAILWAGGLIVSILLSVLGWAVLQQINANDAQKTELSNQIKIMQESERARMLAEQNARLTSGAADAASATVSDGKPVNLGNGSSPNGR